MPKPIQIPSSGFLLVLIAAFCLFGFAATFELTDRPRVFWAFRIAYAVIVISCLSIMVVLTAKKIRRNKNID